MERFTKNILKEITTYEEVVDENGITELVGTTVPNPSYEKILNAKLRKAREKECFPYINRGQLWYATLTAEQQYELSQWYNAWLNITETHIYPEKPSWLK